MKPANYVDPALIACIPPGSVKCKTSFGWEGKGIVHIVTRGCAGKTEILTMQGRIQEFWKGGAR